MSGIALFGGTFDPPHLGHRRLLETAIAAVIPDKTIVMPDRIPPHKQSDRIADTADRLEMCRIAFSEIPTVTVSDWELGREGKSYSIYTVRHLRELYPEGRLWFVMGSDMLLSFEKWFCWEELLTLCTPLCLARCTADAMAALAQSERLSKLTGINDAAKIVQASPLEISSTAVREMLYRGDMPDEYLDSEVLGYIREHGLYKNH